MFNSLGHFFTAVAKGIVHAGRAVEKVAPEVEKLKPVIEGVSGVIFPPSVAIEELGFRLFGAATHAVSDVGQVAAAEGLNVKLDLDTVNEIKALLPELEKFAAAFHMQKPATAAAAVTAGA